MISLNLLVIDGKPYIDVNELILWLDSCREDLNNLSPEEQFKEYGSIDKFITLLLISLSSAISDDLDDIDSSEDQ